MAPWRGALRWRRGRREDGGREGVRRRCERRAMDGPGRTVCGGGHGWPRGEARCAGGGAAGRMVGGKGPGGDVSAGPWTARGGQCAGAAMDGRVARRAALEEGPPGGWWAGRGPAAM